MGVILSRFRKKKSTLEVLEGLEKEIKSIEEYGQSTERRHKAVVGHLVLVSVGLYVLTACLFYFFFFPASLYDQLLYVIPLLLFPLIIVFVKRLVSWWYRRKISRNQEKLSDMKNQKKELLEEVMDKETYKVARQILEKYAPEHLRKTSATSTTSLPRPPLEPGKFSNQLALSTRAVALPASQAGSAGMELRRRPAAVQLLAPSDCLTTPRSSLSSANPRSRPPGIISPGHVMSSEFTPLVSTVPGATTDVIDPSATSMTSMSTIADAVSVAAAKKPDVDDAEEEDEDIDHGQDNDEAGKDTSTATTTTATSTSTTTTSTTVITTTTTTTTAAVASAAAAAPAAAEVAGDKGETRVDNGPLGVSQPSLRLARPILPRERSVMDRLVEYLVGDGVNQRYALICRGCSSHNGMALKEEFEYLAFRCCYCSHWNPARKQRLQSPRLQAAPSSRDTSSSSSTTELTTEEEDERETKSEPITRIPSTGSSDVINATKPEYADSQSSTEEFESLVPDPLADPIADIPTGQEKAESQ